MFSKNKEECKSYLGHNFTYLGRDLVVCSEYEILGGGQRLNCHYVDNDGKIQTCDFSLYYFKQIAL